ncbi:hypothetical protein RF11_02642 [Thelohanellus kitauei]|uniref:Uncharacterized protein n=1 Tax=Thelohanellus kitauei TaxID=669202 RepID=A0A0C2IVB3_THEKT|nr:hypothetical protein RF11_02642 [Thelohanellus kitauei]
MKARHGNRINGVMVDDCRAGQHIPGGYLKVNSLEEQNVTEEINPPKEEWPRYTILVEIKEIGIKLDQTFVGLFYLVNQDVFKWIENFRSLVNRCSWANAGTKKLLFHVVDSR